MIFLEYMTFCKCPADRALSEMVEWPVYTKCVLKRRESVPVLSHMVMTSSDLLPGIVSLEEDVTTA